ncbi:NAD(P)-dependent oxidoreductase [Paenibacillus popilliae]|uniref:Predicted nucleoside-diphosphate sugar epimerase n=1 Tax=Paenibacillus popilliae ATCC 14706 TaxID=1212764 RepID=M9LQG1_PAEPP|nr:NAD(P)H-binding protein [Paenibacillus popilliae]GAC43091.1 predicted nucleoside-diphosphate sugar epimerase [Paenibacillus popilliae ATCC 14706]
MKVTVFGASGGIGKFVLQHALAEGYQVVAYVRNAAKLTVAHSNLTVLQGELSDDGSIRKAVANSDAVISALGPSMSPKAKGYPVFEGHEHIIRAMKKEKVRRLITLATPSVAFEKDKPALITKLPTLMAKAFLPRAYREIVLIGKLVRQSDLDWTVVRIVAPKDRPAAGRLTLRLANKKSSFPYPERISPCLWSSK